MRERSTTADSRSRRRRVRRIAVDALWWATAMVVAQVLIAPLLWVSSVLAGSAPPIGVLSVTVGAFTSPAAGFGQSIAVTALVVAVRSLAPAHNEHGPALDIAGDERGTDAAAGVPGEAGDR